MKMFDIIFSMFSRAYVTSLVVDNTRRAVNPLWNAVDWLTRIFFPILP